jgi:flagellar hook-associated protein 2
MSTSSSTMFTGTSRYSSDFSAIIDRAVAIASLPLVQLQNSQSNLQAQATALNSLNGSITSLANAISSLSTAASQESYSTMTSNAAVLNVSAGEGATNGTYTIEVTDIGAYSTVMSKDGLNLVTDPGTQTISSNPSPTYTLNGTEIFPATNTLNGLAQAINDADLGIQATVVNIGSTASPDYRLALQSTTYDAVAMQLNDGTTDLFDEVTPNGSKVTYKINGVDATPNDSRSITIAPGVTANLVGEGSATVTVTRSTDNISNALSSLANAYNSAVAELDKQYGASAGALAGQAVVSTVWQSIRSLGQWSFGTGEIGALTDLGLTFDQEGKMSFDSSIFAETTDGNIDQLLEFLGSTADGTGFLGAAQNIVDGLQSEEDGILTTAITDMNASITDEGNKISELQARIDDLQESLIAQMAAADALIASLEQQANYINTMFEAMRIAQQSYQ